MTPIAKRATIWIPQICFASTSLILDGQSNFLLELGLTMRETALALGCHVGAHATFEISYTQFSLFSSFPEIYFFVNFCSLTILIWRVLTTTVIVSRGMVFVKNFLGDYRGVSLRLSWHLRLFKLVIIIKSLGALFFRTVLGWFFEISHWWIHSKLLVGKYLFGSLSLRLRDWFVNIILMISVIKRFKIIHWVWVFIHLR